MTIIDENKEKKKLGFIGKVKAKLSQMFSNMDKKLKKKSKEISCCDKKDGNGSSCC